MVELLVVLVVSYLVGSIPVGLMVGKVVKGIDVRRYGSGKTGTANVLRTLGWGPSAVVFGGDLLKGILAVLLARWVLGNPTGEVGAALAAVAGHNWPLYVRFSGGRGVVASMGALFVMMPVATAIGLTAGLAVIALTRYISLGSIIGSLLALFLVVLFVAFRADPLPYLAYAVIAASLIVIQHRDNLLRLWKGTERKVGEKGNTRSPDGKEKPAS